MKNDQWRDWIRREMPGEHVEPVSDDFYRGVWKRIRAAESRSLIESATPVLSLGRACWKAVPACAALVLLVLLYSWRYPPNDIEPVSGTAEFYVLDSDAAPSDTDLLYQIMHNSQASELETAR